jgi:hypothetical protein
METISLDEKRPMGTSALYSMRLANSSNLAQVNAITDASSIETFIGTLAIREYLHAFSGTSAIRKLATVLLRISWKQFEVSYMRL